MRILKYNEHKVSNYNERFKEVASLFLSNLPSDKMIEEYHSGEDDGVVAMQDFIGSNLKGDIHWSTSIAIMDSIDLIINEAVSNSNIKNDYSLK